MFSSKKHHKKNQENYNKDAIIHNELNLNSTLYLAYRDIPTLLKKHLFDKEKKNSYRVLDFGCGAGLSTEIITKMVEEAGHQSETYGVDISEQNIKFARQRLKKDTFLKINSGEKLNYLGKFDLIICNFVLVEMDQHKMTDILKTIQSLLLDSGISIITNCTSKAYKTSNKWYSFNNNFEENIPCGLSNKKITFEEDQPIKLQVFPSCDNDNSFTFFDFFHSGMAYRKAYQVVGLNLLQTHKPVGKESDHIDWKCEKEYSPYKIHIVSKQNQPRIEMKNNLI